MDLINREQALRRFWSYGDMEGNGYDETDMPAYDRLQALPIVAEVEDCISRQAAIDLWDKYHPYISIKAMAYDRELRALPSAQPRMKGKWIKRSGTINCSICKHSNWSECFEDTVMSFNYCPNCGAEMEK